MNFKVFANRQSNKIAQDIAIGAPSIEDSDRVESGGKHVTTDFDQVSEKLSEDVQFGVKKVEAVTLTWTKNELIFAYAW